MNGPGSAVAWFVTEAQDNVADIPLDEPVGWVALAMMGLAVLVGPWVMVLGTRHLRQGYRIFANDPVGAGEAHLADGVVEVEGTARPLDGTLSGEYTDEPAVVQTWRRQRKEETTDSDGNTTSTWKTVERGSDSVPFLVADDTGQVAVDPSGATLSVDQSRVRESGWLRGRNETHRRYEGRIEPGDSVHVFGQTLSASDPADAPGENRTYVGGGSDVSEFVVSAGSELRTVVRYCGFGVLLVGAAALWIPVSSVVFLVLLEEAFAVPTASWLVDVFG